MIELYATGSAVVLGQVQVVKRLLPDRFHRWLPACALAFGIVWGLTLPGRPLVERIFGGLGAGIGAVGAFDGVRATVEKPTATT
jgi:hypothetical protein